MANQICKLQKRGSFMMKALLAGAQQPETEWIEKCVEITTLQELAALAETRKG